MLFSFKPAAGWTARVTRAGHFELQRVKSDGVVEVRRETREDVTPFYARVLISHNKGTSLGGVPRHHEIIVRRRGESHRALAARRLTAERMEQAALAAVTRRLREERAREERKKARYERRQLFRELLRQNWDALLEFVPFWAATELIWSRMVRVDWVAEAAKSGASWLSGRERNKLMHALNGNINGFQSFWRRVTALKAAKKLDRDAQVVAPATDEVPSNRSASFKSVASTAASRLSQLSSMSAESRDELASRVATEAHGDATFVPLPRVGQPVASTSSVRDVGRAKKELKKRLRAARPWTELEQAARGHFKDFTLEFVTDAPALIKLAEVVGEEAVEDLVVQSAGFARRVVAGRFRGEKIEVPDSPAIKTALRMRGALREEAVGAASFVAALNRIDSRPERIDTAPVLLGGKLLSEDVEKAFSEALIYYEKVESQLPGRNFKRARDSTMADIEVNPGPGLRPASFLLSVVNKFSDRWLIPLAENLLIQIKLKAPKEAPVVLPPEERVADFACQVDYFDMPDVIPKFASWRAQRRQVPCKAHGGTPLEHRWADWHTNVSLPRGVLEKWYPIMWRELVTRCPEDHVYLREMITWGFGIDGGDRAPPIPALMQTTDIRVGRFRCNNPAHDFDAIKRWHQQFPAFVRTEHGGMPDVNFRWQGTSHYQCPLCNDTPDMLRAGIDFSIPPRGNANLGASFAHLCGLFKNIMCTSKTLFLIGTGETTPDVDRWAPTHTIVVVAQLGNVPEWARPYQTVQLHPQYWILGFWFTVLFAGVASGGNRYLVAYDAHLARIPLSVWVDRPGTWYLVQPDGLHGLAWLVDPARFPQAEMGAAVLAIRYRFAQQIFTTWLMGAAPIQYYYVGELGATDYAGLDVDLREAPNRHITGVVTGTGTRLMYKFEGPALYSLPSAVYLLRKMTAAPYRGSLSLVRLMMAWDNPGHSGRTKTIRSEELPFDFPRIVSCGCFQCTMRHRYGTIYVGLGGTRGDRVPLLAYGPVFNGWGLDVCFVELLPVDYGTDYLASIQQGKVLEGAYDYLTRLASLATISGITIGAPEMNAQITVAMSPPRSVRRGPNFRLGPLANGLLGWISGDQAITWRVASYPGVLNLPRSADGVSFLPGEVPTGKRKHKVLYAMGSSGYPIPAGGVSVTPGDHFAQFATAETVVCHGGAGTVQTAAAAGARVVSADSALDRAYYDPTNAGHGVVAGADPNKAILLLLGVDFVPLVIAFRGGIRLGIDAFRAYCQLYLLVDLTALYALFTNINGALPVVPTTLAEVGGLVLARMIGFEGPILGILAAYLLIVLANVMIGYFDLTPSGFIMAWLRMTRSIPSSPIGLAVAARYGPTVGAMFVYVQRQAFAVIAAHKRALQRKDTWYVAIYFVYGLPIHAVVENRDASIQYEGTDIAGLRERIYVLRQVERDVETRAFRFPIDIDGTKFDAPSLAGRPYFWAANNCQTVILAVVSNSIPLLGFAAPVLFVALAMAALLGLLGFAILLLLVLLSLLLCTMFGLDIGNSFKLLSVASIRERELLALERAAPSQSFVGYFARVASILLHMGALTSEDREILGEFRAVSDLVKDISSQANDAVRNAMVTLLSSAPPFTREVLTPFGVLAGVLDTQGVDSENLLESLDASVTSFARVLVAASVETASLPSNGVSSVDYMRLSDGEEADLLNYLPAVAAMVRAERSLFDEIDVDSDDPADNTLLTRLFASTPSFELFWGAFVDVITKVPWGECTIEFEQATDVDGDELDVFWAPIWRHFFFRLTEGMEGAPEEVPVIDGFEEAPSLDHEAAMAATAALGLSLGLDDVQAVANALLETRPAGQGPEPVITELDAAGDKAIADFHDLTRGAVDAIAHASRGWTWFRRWLRRHHVNATLLGPIDVAMGFVGLVAGKALEGFTRVLSAFVGLVAWDSFEGAYWLRDFLAKMIMFIQMLDPRHRSSPKAVWALLWKRARANVTRTEQMIFAMAQSTYEKPASYGEWVDQMAALLDRPGVDTSVLRRVPPSRILFRPSDPVGVSEYFEIDALKDIHWNETAESRAAMDASIAAGNPLAVDMAWMARPESTRASLARYEVPRPACGEEGQLALSLAAKALFDHYRPLYERPLPMTPAAVAHLSKWKYSAGLPFLPVIRKREALRHSEWFQAIITAAERILETGKMPAVGMHGFAKNQIQSVQTLLDFPFKLRTVTAGDRVTFTAVNTVLMERNKRPGYLEAGLLNMERRSEGGILALKPFLDRFPNKYSGDGTAFDSSVVREVATVGSVELFRRGFEQHGMHNTKAVVSMVKAYYEALTAGLIVDLQSGDVIWKTGGGGTGSAATTPDNRDWTRLVFVAAYVLVTGKPADTFFDHFAFTNASDDVFFSVSDEMNPMLDQMRSAMFEHFGVRFSLVPESTMNNILHLVHVPREQLDAEMYSLVGAIPPEEGGLRHQKERLLFTRSAFRADRMRLNPVVARAHIMEREAGYQLLTAHSPDLYDLCTRSLLDAGLGIARKVWKDARVDMILSETGLVVDGAVVMGPDVPSNFTSTLHHKAHNAVLRGTAKTELDYMLGQARVARRFLKQRRGKSYKAVFESWVKPPPDHPDRKVSKRYRVYSEATRAIGPVADLVRLGILRMYALQAAIPRALTAIAPESVTLALPAAFNTWDYPVEQYIWRREYLRSRQYPTTARMAQLIRESPFAAATDLSSFMLLLGQPGMLEALCNATENNRAAAGSSRFQSNDCVMGQVLLILVVYTGIDVAIRAIEKKAILGVFVILAFGLYRWLEVFYSLQSLAFWTVTGTASLAISNTMPKDRYMLQKLLSVGLVSSLPYWLTAWWFGCFKALGALEPIIEVTTVVPNLLMHTNNLASEVIVKSPSPLWGPTLASLRIGEPAFIVGGTGTGKSTSFVLGLRKLVVTSPVIIAVPTNRLVVGYVNDFLRPSEICRVRRGDPALSFDDLDNTWLYVMTYGQLTVRAASFPRGTVVLFDEAHTCEASVLMGVTAVLQHADTKGFWPLAATATPAGPLAESFLSTWRRYDVTTPPRYSREHLGQVGDFGSALDAISRAGVNLRDVMFYHPSVSTLLTWGNSLAHTGLPVRYATAHSEAVDGAGAVLGSLVVLAGANIRPAPALLAYSPLGLAYRSDLGRDIVTHVPLGELAHHFKLQTVNLSYTQLTQLVGRVGRERPGLTLCIGDQSEPGPEAVSYGLFSMVEGAPIVKRAIRHLWPAKALGVMPDVVIGGVFVRREVADEDYDLRAEADGLALLLLLSDSPDILFTYRVLDRRDHPDNSAEAEALRWVTTILSLTGRPAPSCTGPGAALAGASRYWLTRTRRSMMAGLALIPVEDGLRPVLIAHEHVQPQLHVEVSGPVTTPGMVTLANGRPMIGVTGGPARLLGLGVGPRGTALGRNARPELRPCWCAIGWGNHRFREHRSLLNPGIYGLPIDASLLTPPPQVWNIRPALNDLMMQLRQALSHLPAGTNLDVRTWNGTLEPRGTVLVMYPPSEDPQRMPGRIYFPLPKWYDDKIALAHARLLPLFWKLGDFGVLITNGRPEPWLRVPQPLPILTQDVISDGHHHMPVCEFVFGPSGAFEDNQDAFGRVMGKYFYTYAVDLACLLTSPIVVPSDANIVRHNDSLFPGTSMATGFFRERSDGTRVRVSRVPDRPLH